MNLTSNRHLNTLCILVLLLIFSLKIPVLFHDLNTSLNNDTPTYMMEAPSNLIPGLKASTSIKVIPFFLFIVLFVVFPMIIVKFLFQAYLFINASIPIVLKQLFLSPIKFTSIFVSKASL